MPGRVLSAALNGAHGSTNVESISPRLSALVDGAAPVMAIISTFNPMFLEDLDALSLSSPVGKEGGWSVKPARFDSSAANASPRDVRAGAVGRSRGRARCRLQLDMIQLGDVVQIGKMGAPEQAAARDSDRLRAAGLDRRTATSNTAPFIKIGRIVTSDSHRDFTIDA